jgi:hypothetical protein
MVTQDQTITGVWGLGADAPDVLRRTAERIPDQLNSQLPLMLHPFYSFRSRGGPIFSRARFRAPFDRSTHDNWQ